MLVPDYFWPGLLSSRHDCHDLQTLEESVKPVSLPEYKFHRAMYKTAACTDCIKYGWLQFEYLRRLRDSTSSTWKQMAYKEAVSQPP